MAFFSSADGKEVTWGCKGLIVKVNGSGKRLARLK